MNKRIALILLGCLMMTMLTGCSVSDSSKEKVADLDFTVVEEINLPKEIQELIETKKTEEFRVVFTAKENMYIVIGYGEKASTGYSIAVDELYQTPDSIFVKTSLISPHKGENVVKQVNYPYIVLMLENMDYPVIFD